MRYLLFSIILTAQLFGQPVFYPLHIGDTWQYRDADIASSDTFTYSYKALSDTLIAGQIYTVKYNNNYPYSFERQNGDSVYLYRFGKEVLYFDFSRSAGDTVSVTALGKDTMVVVLLYTDTEMYFGTSRRTWTFYVNPSKDNIDDEYTVTVANGIGIVYIGLDFGPSMKLIGAVINGVQYGVILDVQKYQQEQHINFKVDQNFPNPFNPTTTIRFFLPLPSYVTIEVFNNIGQCILQEHYSILSAGSHNFYFTASSLSSGIYYYQIKSSFGRASVKMIFMK